MWDRWPWAPFQTVTQSQDQFVTAMLIQILATAFVMVALAIAMAVTLGLVAAGIAAAAVAIATVAGNYVRWKAGRQRALWYAWDQR